MKSQAFVLITIGSALLSLACQREPLPDAYGNVEAIEVIVGAESGGRIETLGVVEGMRLAAGQQVGVIETTGLELERNQLEAQRAAIASRTNEISQQIGVLQVQREIARRGYDRTRRLFDQRAATAQQLDAAEREFRVLGQQIEAARAQSESVQREIEAAEARTAQMEERIGRGKIVNPSAGTVLATYARTGEVIQPGQPLYRIANLDAVEVRAYVVETQLSGVRIGQPARVTVDVGEDARRTIDGTVIWVSGEAEFTPTPIQTREERADLVYAIRIRVPNPGGLLKIGMPVDIEFPVAGAAS